MTETVDVQKLLEDSGLTQREFAALIGVTRTTVSRWVSGEYTPTPAIERVVNVFANSINAAVEAGQLPDSLPTASRKTVEERWDAIQRIISG